MHIFIKIIPGLLFLLSHSVFADFKSGGDAYKSGDYDTAFKEFLPLAQEGDHRAMYALGSMYAAGHGTERDLDAALKWFKKAATYGRPDAEYKLGWMYSRGLGVGQDHRRAINWYGKSAKKGFAKAQYQVGLSYLAGHGVEQDFIKSYAWLNTAAANGSEEAMQNLKEIKQQLTDEELIEAEKLARNYNKKYIPRRKY